jgi:pyruvate kinase
MPVDPASGAFVGLRNLTHAHPAKSETPFPPTPVIRPITCPDRTMQPSIAPSKVDDLLTELQTLRESCLGLERDFGASIAEACPQSRYSVQNLVHYLALRKRDLRDLQSRLASLGLSSLGRSESSVMAELEAVIAVLEALAGEHRFAPPDDSSCVNFTTGPSILAEHANDLMGPVPKGRAVRIMVTMPSEAAQSYDLVKSLVGVGMDVMRVNCAHDSEREWGCMIAYLRRANQELGKYCKVLMDLGGPKLRTGLIRHGYRVVRWKVAKDGGGAIIGPARIALVSKHASSECLSSADALLPMPATLLETARVGDIVRIKHSGKGKRRLTVIEKGDYGCLCSCEKGAYILNHAEWSLVREGRELASGHVAGLPFVEEPIRLHAGDLLVLTNESGMPLAHPSAIPRDLPHIACTLPEAFSAAQAGQPIFFDDGKIKGRIREVHPDHMLVEIVHAVAQGCKLGSAKGINLPESDLGLSAMTEKDRRDLDFVAQHADIVGLSFVRRPEDVLELQHELAARGKSDVGINLKIESRQGFDQLPLIMIAALRHHPVGIMVARGDLAVEVGFERLAEIQEEILWLSEAAHIPVTWATQVLETLAKTGTPSRAEVTDAAMGVRAECVMLNKGEHIVDTVRFLDHILHRMQAHHLKKRSMLRGLAVAQVSHA